MPTLLAPTLRRIERSASGLILAQWIDHDDALAEVVDSVLSTHTDAAMSAGVRAYEIDRERSGITRPYQAAMPDRQQLNVESLIGWARGEALTEETFKTILLSGAQKRIASAARRSIMSNAAEDPAAAGWQRRARADGCYFCKMLAGRAELYTSEDTASFASHEDCFCEAVPAWGGKPRPVRKYTPSARNVSDADRARARKWMREHADELAAYAP